MSIPGLSTLYAIFKRDIDRNNTVLSKRLELANELQNNAQKWTLYLQTAFNEAIKLYRRGLMDDALHRVLEQQEDFLKLDYDSLKIDGPILTYLGEDSRFNDFVNCCSSFYRSALDIKRLVYTGIENSEGEIEIMIDDDIEVVAITYRAEVERMHRGLLKSYNKLKTIEPK